jgi:hypothetical protein
MPSCHYFEMLTMPGRGVDAENDFFTYTGLHAFLENLSRGCSVFPLGAWTGQPGVILRHDVDLDLCAAERVAEIEAKVGVRASFFCMTTAETYNVSSPSGRAIIRRIHDVGGEIALHFDPTVYGDASAMAMAAAAAREADALEQITGSKVRSVSLHNPSITGEYPVFEGWQNAYDPRIFSPRTYLSDSRMLFSSDPVTFLAQATERTFQLLLHPMHYSPDGRRYPAAMLSYVRDMVGRVDAVFRVNTAYQEHVGDRIFHHLAAAAATWQ